jgi:hypothetical protein
MTTDLIQGSDEWKAARIGKVTASKIADICATIKNGDWGATRENYAAQLVCERLTGAPMQGYVNAEMQWGTDHEAEAKGVYEWVTGEPVVNVGFIPHPTIAMAGASPDGYVGEEGGVELKCPNSATHIKTLMGGSIPKRYVLQCQWQMACKPGQLWVDYCSYDPRLSPAKRFYVQRIKRDNAKIAELEKIVTVFLAEVAELVDGLNKKFPE